jgi:hypothetical protein
MAINHRHQSGVANGGGWRVCCLMSINNGSLAWHLAQAGAGGENGAGAGVIS